MGKDYEEIENFILAHIGEGMPNIAKCGCGQILEVVQGTVDYNQKDENMKTFSREAAECMARNRVRCPREGCGKNFCSNSQCKAEPYHSGKTCEEYKEMKEA